MALPIASSANRWFYLFDGLMNWQSLFTRIFRWNFTLFYFVCVLCGCVCVWCVAIRVSRIAFAFVNWCGIAIESLINLIYLKTILFFMRLPCTVHGFLFVHQLNCWCPRHTQNRKYFHIFGVYFVSASAIEKHPAIQLFLWNYPMTLCRKWWSGW